MYKNKPTSKSSKSKMKLKTSKNVRLWAHNYYDLFIGTTGKLQYHCAPTLGIFD